MFIVVDYYSLVVVKATGAGQEDSGAQIRDKGFVNVCMHVFFFIRL